MNIYLEFVSNVSQFRAGQCRLVVYPAAHTVVVSEKDTGKHYKKILRI